MTVHPVKVESTTVTRVSHWATEHMAIRKLLSFVLQTIVAGLAAAPVARMKTKKIGDLSQEYGVSMAMHMAGTPISTMASTSADQMISTWP